eukprot:1643320-Prymnesium_polylepis.2
MPVTIVRNRQKCAMRTIIVNRPPGPQPLISFSATAANFPEGHFLTSNSFRAISQELVIPCRMTRPREAPQKSIPGCEYGAKCGQVYVAEEGKKPPRLCGASWRLA